MVGVVRRRDLDRWYVRVSGGFDVIRLGVVLSIVLAGWLWDSGDLSRWWRRGVRLWRSYRRRRAGRRG
ncbi:hypothetical protein GCM10009677_17330 [Sphaerisporangium rubeum]|uniref:Uncharacterized protein n=1 Tax=Sphaerisporangium rubeum TaxID=321317 RepID=A0A7X0IIJ0_9ACTN|nr:hypothetical protein [Sphaerisporangium rubeum]